MQNVLFKGHPVTLNYVFVVVHSEPTKNNSYYYLIGHVEETKFMEKFNQIREKISSNYHKCLTNWLGSVTFMQSLLLLSDISAQDTHLKNI